MARQPIAPTWQDKAHAGTRHAQGAKDADILCRRSGAHLQGPSGNGAGVEVQALQGLNLRIDPGELVAVIGASGSGKSTLLSILSSLDQPTAGVAWVAGHDLLTMKEKERVRVPPPQRGLRVAADLAQPPAVPHRRARTSPPRSRSRAAKGAAAARRARVTELLDLLEVSHCAERRPAEMSGGEQQRVAIAVGIANDPRVLLADEPTGELDDATSAHVLEAMRSVNRELGVTTLIVTHDPSGVGARRPHRADPRRTHVHRGAALDPRRRARHRGARRRGVRGASTASAACSCPMSS